jgi:ABC-2 type transport system ATP-binding protein
MKDDMEGDGLHVVLASAEHTGEAAAVLTGAGLGGVVVDGQAVHARADRGAEAVPRILLALDRSGIEVHEVTVSRPSLDDVFLRHTGRRYSPDDPEVSS